MIYLACPYSHEDPAIRASRFHAVNIAAARLIANDIEVFSPISHSHPIAEIGGLPMGWQFWRAFDLRFLDLCSAMAVLMVEGYAQSHGVRAEVQAACDRDMPIVYIPAECLDKLPDAPCWRQIKAILTAPV